jgi:hypothetical protein
MGGGSPGEGEKGIESIHLVIDPMSCPRGGTGPIVPYISIIIQPLSSSDRKSRFIFPGNSLRNVSCGRYIPDDPCAKRAATGLMRVIHRYHQRLHLLLQPFYPNRGRDVVSITGIPGRKFCPGKLQDQFLHTRSDTFSAQ